MKLLAKTALALAGASAVAVTTSVPAMAADNTSYYWSNNSYTGYCGQVDGGYVVAAQEMLHTYGTYGGAIDNYWGNGSHNAMVNYQSLRGLSADGCAGPQTWDNMQKLTAYFTTAYVCGSTQGAYYRFVKNGRVSNHLRPASGTRYWAADVDANAGGPVQNYQYYRFSDDLRRWC